MDKWRIFVFEPEIFKYLKNDSTYLERDPFEKLAKKKKLKHSNTMVFGAWTPKEIKIY